MPQTLDDISLTIAIDLIMRGATIGLLLMIAAIIWRDRRQSLAVKLGIYLCIGLCIHVVHSTVAIHKHLAAWPDALIVSIANGNNPLFWLFAMVICIDDFVLKKRYLFVWIGTIALSLLNQMLRASSHQALHWILDSLLTWIPVVFAVLAIAVAVKHWRVDLVEKRRWLRGFIVLGGAAYIGISTAGRISSAHEPLAFATSAVDTLALLFIVCVITFRLLSLRSSELFSEAARASRNAYPPANASDSETSSVVKVLDNLMTKDRVYRQENLSIGNLAKLLTMPEYKLRLLINQHLGYRNFTAYLNHYRLDDVSTRLSDPKQQHLPVLTLALEAGFQSIGPFNRAFKARFGKTPSEYRKNT